MTASPLPCRDDVDASAPFRIGLGGCACRLSADTSAGSEALAHWFGRYRLPETAATDLEIHLALRDPERPRITIRDADRTYDFSDLASGPEWKRFVPVPHPGRRLLADTLLGPEPVLELAAPATLVLKPTLWPLYVSIAWQWLLLQKRSLCCVHAAISAAGGQAIALLGTSGSGKSTLSHALQAAGADYFGDDGAYFSLPEHRLHPLPRELCLRPGGLAALGTATGAGSWHELKRGDPKYVVRLQPPNRPCPDNRVILFFLAGFADRPQLQPISGGEATRLLFSQMAYASTSITARLQVASGLANRYSCRRLVVGPPRPTAELLLRSLEGC
jgi:hypothetical protein